MNSKVLRVLRYNTGNDKKVFLEFKNYFDLVLVNANIVAYTKSAIVDLISIHKKEYVIDPQTHIFMHDPYFYSTKLGKIKKSIEKYLEEMPQEIQNVILREKTALTPEFLEKNIDNLNQAVYNFQKNSISKNLKDKEYNKYLEFSGIEVLPPKFLIATYFMLRSKDDDNTKIKWLNLNKKSIENFIEKKIENIAAQLVIDKEVLLNESLLVKIKEAYDLKGYEYIFLWIDDFSTFSVNKKEKEAFKNLIFALNSIGKKVIMAYGGYDSILLCHDKSLCKLYGVAQSAGYGEFRKVTPVGGGMPTNKFYFFPLHSRMNIEIVLQKMVNKG